MKTHVYPGMGADHRMYQGAWVGIENVLYHDWPIWKGEDSIKNMANRVISEHKIKCGDVIVGSSLGGMIACEIANQMELSALWLVGSAKDHREVSRLLSLAYPLIDLVPLELVKKLAGKIGGELLSMFSQSEASFIRAMSRAIFDWEGLVNDRVKVSRIHGRRDYVIPVSPDVDFILNGGHLIAMSHAQECVSLIWGNQN